MDLTGRRSKLLTGITILFFVLVSLLMAVPVMAEEGEQTGSPVVASIDIQGQDSILVPVSR